MRWLRDRIHTRGTFWGPREVLAHDPGDQPWPCGVAAGLRVASAGEAAAVPCVGITHRCLSPSCRHGVSAVEQRRRRHPPLCGCQRCRRELPLPSEGFPGPHSSWIRPGALQRLHPALGRAGERWVWGGEKPPPGAGDAPSRRSTGALSQEEVRSIHPISRELRARSLQLLLLDLLLIAGLVSAARPWLGGRQG